MTHIRKINIYEFSILTEVFGSKHALGVMFVSLIEILMSLQVQWNVCHALGNLFLNRSVHLSSAPW
jgi:hypothetical protein